jgi:DNA-directed RNA polymerase subunit RPC12/RpoP
VKPALQSTHAGALRARAAAFAAGLLATALCVVTSGCGNAVDDALESDARGYLCESCTNRFQTDANVFADVCPRCGSVELLEVVGYVCPADNEATLAPRGKFVPPCRVCGQRTAGLRLPTAKDLEAWGAARQSRAEVARKPNSN